MRRCPAGWIDCPVCAKLETVERSMRLERDAAARRTQPIYERPEEVAAFYRAESAYAMRAIAEWRGPR